MNTKQLYYRDIETATEGFIEENRDKLIKLALESEKESPDDILYEIEDKFELQDKIFELADGVFLDIMLYGSCRDCSSDMEGWARILAVSEEVADDSGLWEGLEPEKAIQAMAFFTVENDIMIAVMEKIEQMINVALKVKEGRENGKR